MTPWWLASLPWLGAYLIGAIPFGYLVALARGVDIFAQGSGNIGATNVARVLGKRFGILVFLLDFAKGAVPVAVALRLSAWAMDPGAGQGLPPGWLETGAGLAAFLGHLFPVYLRFRGGKGVATGAGVVAVLVPGPTLAALFTWVVVLAATRYVSLASVAAVLVLCMVRLAWSAPPLDLGEPRNGFCLLAAALVLIRHRANLVRLWQGNENRLKESPAMHQFGKTLHVLALGLWFGSCIFFTFVVAFSLFQTFLSHAQTNPRPNWFPLPTAFARIDGEVNGPREQGSRAAGQAVGPIFHFYYLIQGVCALTALFTALPWSRGSPGQRVHRWRVGLLAAGLMLVLIGWPLERKVSELRVPRNEAMDAYLQGGLDSTTANLADMKAAKAEFDRWHTYSMLVNFATVLLVTAAMALAGRLPEHRPLPAPVQAAPELGREGTPAPVA